MSIDRDFLLQRVRPTLFQDRITSKQAEGLRLLIAFWEKIMGAQADRRQLAYVLATAFHETGFTLQPIREKGGKAYLTANYDIRGENPARARRNGNTEPGDGVRYAGRGYVQLTWKNNYHRVGELLGVDLVGNPDRALEPETAATILIRGMSEGWFTGRKLDEFFNATRAEWVQARRIVNGVDKAPLIAGYAQKFLAAMTDKPPKAKPSRPSQHPQPSSGPRQASR